MYSASVTARRRAWRSSTSARSSSVRATVVTGIPSLSVTSSAVSRPLRWIRIPFRLIRPARDGTVTSMTLTPPAASPTAPRHSGATAPPPAHTPTQPRASTPPSAADRARRRKHRGEGGRSASSEPTRRSRVALRPIAAELRPGHNAPLPPAQLLPTGVGRLLYSISVQKATNPKIWAPGAAACCTPLPLPLRPRHTSAGRLRGPWRRTFSSGRPVSWRRWFIPGRSARPSW